MFHLFGVLAPRFTLLDYNHVHTEARMPIFSTNRGYIGGSNTAFTVLFADSVLPR